MDGKKKTIIILVIFSILILLSSICTKLFRLFVSGTKNVIQVDEFMKKQLIAVRYKFPQLADEFNLHRNTTEFYDYNLYKFTTPEPPIT